MIKLFIRLFVLMINFINFAINSDLYLNFSNLGTPVPKSISELNQTILRYAANLSHLKYAKINSPLIRALGTCYFLVV